MFGILFGIKPFRSPAALRHSNTRQVWYSDPHCIKIASETAIATAETKKHNKAFQYFMTSETIILVSGFRMVTVLDLWERNCAVLVSHLSGYTD